MTRVDPAARRSSIARMDQVNPEPSVEAYKRFTMIRVEALNHAIKGLPKDRIRFHLCWGSWHGRMSRTFQCEISSMSCWRSTCRLTRSRRERPHEHEWRVWRDINRPREILIPASSVTHQRRRAPGTGVRPDRSLRQSGGRENVIASTTVASAARASGYRWAKLKTLARGRSWRRSSCGMTAERRHVRPTTTERQR